MVNSLLKLNDDTEMYGMVIAKNDSAVKFAAKKVNDGNKAVCLVNIYRYVCVAQIKDNQQFIISPFGEKILFKLLRLKGSLST